MILKTKKWLSQLVYFMECLWDCVLVLSVIAGIAFLYLAFFGFEKSVGEGTIARSHNLKDFVIGVLLGILAIVFLIVLQSRLRSKNNKYDDIYKVVGTASVLVCSYVGWLLFLVGGCNWIRIDSKEVSTGFFAVSQSVPFEQVRSVTFVKPNIDYRSEYGPLSYLYAPRVVFRLISSEKIELQTYPVSYVAPELCGMLKSIELLDESESKEHSNLLQVLYLTFFGLLCLVYFVAKSIVLLAVAWCYLGCLGKYNTFASYESAASIDTFAIAQHHIIDLVCAFSIGYWVMLFFQPLFVFDLPNSKLQYMDWHEFGIKMGCVPLVFAVVGGTVCFWLGWCKWIRIDSQAISLSFLFLVFRRIDFREIAKVRICAALGDAKIQLKNFKVVRLPIQIIRPVETQFRQILGAKGVLVIDQDAHQGFKDFTDAVDRTKSGKNRSKRDHRGKRGRFKKS